jgi:hypothetical protein
MTEVSFLVEMTGSKYVTAGRRSGMNLAAASGSYPSVVSGLGVPYENGHNEISR